MIHATVHVTEGWGREIARRVNAVAKDAVGDASKEGAKVASGLAGSRRRTGTMATMELLPVVETPTGFEGGFRSKAWYAGFQSRGTRSGITPLGFLQAGQQAARKQLVDRINRIGG